MSNMKNKLAFIFMILASVVMLTACGGSSPEKSTEKFLASYKELNIEEMSKYVSKEIKQTIEDESSELEDGMLTEELKSSVKRYASELEYEIVDVNVDKEEGSAVVNLNFIYADGGEVVASSMGEIFGQLMGQAFSNEESSDEEVNKELSNILVKNLDINEIKKESVSGEITLKLEEDIWKIAEVDDEVLNVLTIGLINGLDSWNPFGNLEFEDNLESNKN